MSIRKCGGFSGIGRWAVLLAAATLASVSFAAGVTYTYDEIGRLKTATYDDGTVVTYNLDAAGNRTTVVTTVPGSPGQIQWAATTYAGAEGGAVVTISATRTVGTTGAVSASYTLSGTATVGAANDYTASGTLSWAGGNSTNQTVAVTIVDDAVFDPGETVVLTLSAPTGGATLGTQTVTTLTITDNDPPPSPGTIQWAASTYAGSEGGAAVTLNATRTGGTAGAVSASYAISGTATPGDYTIAGTLNWASGNASNQPIVVTITDDVDYDPGETVVLTLNSPTGGATLGAPTVTTLTITDNDPPPATGTLQLSAPTYSVGENGGSLTITVTRSGGSSGPASVNYATSNGTAFAGSDFTATSGTLSWLNGESGSKTFNIPILDDADVEGSQTFTVTLSGVTGATAGAPAGATVTITDWEVGTLALSPTSYNVTEGATTVTVTVTRSGGNDGAVGVSYATSNGTAVAGSDYTAASGALSWGSGDGATKSFAVTILDDTVGEPSKTVNLALASPTGGATLGASAGTITIADNEAGSLQFVSPPSSIAENGSSLTFTVSRSNGSTGAASVLCSAVAGNATAGNDFTNPNATLSWANGDPANKTCVVPILEDTAFEGNETFTVQLSGATGAALGAPISQSVTITDNDPDPLPTAPLSGPNISAVTSSSATATWGAASDIHPGGGVVGYRYSLNGGASWTNVGNVLTASLTGLTAGTNYTLQVQAQDTASQWGASASGLFETPASGSNTPTLTVGESGWNGFDQTIGFFSGWYGSMTPGSDLSGKGYRGLYDYYSDLTGLGFPIPVYSRYVIHVPSGINPGAGYLTSLTANGVTVLGSNATYTWTPGSNQAVWWWDTGTISFGFLSGQVLPVTVVTQ